MDERLLKKEAYCQKFVSDQIKEWQKIRALLESAKFSEILARLDFFGIDPAPIIKSGDYDHVIEAFAKVQPELLTVDELRAEAQRLGILYYCKYDKNELAKMVYDKRREVHVAK